MHWYFRHPRHHEHYNHLSTHFVDHYNGHRNSGTTITMGVGEWRGRNREIISDGWLSDKARLPERLREYGRFENGREQYNTKNPGRTLDPGQYLEKNARQYPNLERSRTQAQAELQRERTDVDRKRSDWAPAKEPVKPEPARVPRTDQPVPPKTQPARTLPADKAKPGEPAARPPRPAAEPAKKPSIDDAKDYHRDKWQEPQRTIPKTERAPATRPAPATERAPTPRPKPATNTPTPRKETPAKPSQQPAAKPQKQRGG